MGLNIAVSPGDDTRCKNSRYPPTYDAAPPRSERLVVRIATSLPPFPAPPYTLPTFSAPTLS